MSGPPVKLTVPIDSIDLYRTLKPLALYRNDPTSHLRPSQFARATRTPDGPATVKVDWDDTTADVEFWGDGSTWLRDRIDALLGLSDDVTTFEPANALVARLWKEFRGQRITASHTLWHDVAWLIPGQRVTSDNAADQWQAITRRFSEPAPGPLGLLLPPAAEVLAKTPYPEFHTCGIERKRAQNLQSAGKYIPRFERLTDLSSADLRQKLELIPGIGPWTATNVLTMTMGDPDAVVLGDYGLPSSVTWAFARERVGTDARMLELLEPHRPHRWRVCRLIMSSGVRAPRRGPRRENPRIHRM